MMVKRKVMGLLRSAIPVVFAVTIGIFSTGSFAEAQEVSSFNEQKHKLFGKYPELEGLNEVIELHLGKTKWREERSVILHLSWFPYGSDASSAECFLDVEGGLFMYEKAHGSIPIKLPDGSVDVGPGTGTASFAQLKKSQLADVRKHIRQLPDSDDTPPLSELLILSMKQGDAWVTRTYDRKHYPDKVDKIVKLIRKASKKQRVSR